MSEHITTIYALLDPRDNRVRYVGKSVRPESRFRQHLFDAKRGRHYPVCRWIRKLQVDGVKPTMLTLERRGEGWIEAEQFWIRYFRGYHSDMLNVCDGGEGIPGHVPSAANRARNAVQARKRMADPENREKVSRGLKRFYEENPEAAAALGERARKAYIVTFPDGHEEHVRGLKPFCQKHGLNVANMSHVARGIVATCKGFRVRYADQAYQPTKREAFQARQEHAAGLIKQGMSIKAVCEASGVSPSAARRLRIDLGLSPRPAATRHEQPRLKEEVYPRVVEMLSAGIPCHRIASEFGLHVSTIQKWSHRAGLRRGKARTYTPAERAEKRAAALEMFKRGASKSEIAAVLDVPLSTIYSWTPR